MQSSDGDKRNEQAPNAPRDGAGETPPAGAEPSTPPAEGGDAHPASESAAERVIAAFGGIRPMASKVGVPATTVQGWKKRGVIPEARRDELLKAAADNGITLDDQALGEALTVDESPDSGRSEDREKASEAGADKMAEKSGRKGGVATGSSPWDGSAAAKPANSADRSGTDRSGTDRSGTDRSGTDHSGTDRRGADRPASEGAASDREALTGGAQGTAGSGPSGGGPLGPAGAASAGSPPSNPGSPSPVQSRDTGVLALAVIALIVAVIAVAGLLTYPAWSPRYMGTPDPALLADRLDSLEAELEQSMQEPRAAVEDFEGRVAAMESDMTDALERIDAFTGVEIRGRPLVEILDNMDAQSASVAERVEQLDDRIGARLPALEDRIEAIEGQSEAIESLEGRIEGLESERAALGDVRQAIDSLDRRIGAVEDTVDGVSGRLDSVAGVAEQAAATDASTLALVLAVGQVRDALFNGAPFEQSLETVRTVSSDDGDIAAAAETLAPYAVSGAPTLSELQTRFPAMADAVREAARAPASGSWSDEALSRVQGLVSVRPAAGEVEGDTPNAVLARAEVRIDSDNLRGAVDALADLEGAPAEAAADWMSLARDRIAVEDALATLNDTAVRRLMATRDGG